MTQRFKYDSLVHWDAPSPSYNVAFERMVEEGWRLVCVTKVSKENFVSYWEKPTDD
jgi:hypothetical protein